MSIKFVENINYLNSFHELGKGKENIRSIEITYIRSETDSLLATFTWKYLQQTTSMSWCEGATNDEILTVLQATLEKVKRVVSPHKGETEIWWNPILHNLWCTMRQSLHAHGAGTRCLVARAWILTRASPKFISEHNDPLWCAAFLESPTMWEELIAMGASPSLYDVQGEKLFHRIFYTINKPFTTNTASFLIERGVDLNCMDAKGKSALAHAVDQQHNQTVSFLLQKNANPNKASSSVHTPLTLAVIREDKELITQLIQAGANPLLNEVNDQFGAEWAWAKTQETAALVDQSVKGFFSELQRRTLLSHRFSIPIKTQIQNRHYSTEGWDAVPKTLSASALYESYLDSIRLYGSDHGFGLSKEAYKLFFDALNSLNPDNPEATPEQLALKYRQNKIVALQTAWKGHATFTVICPSKQILIHCNAGMRKQEREAGMWVAHIGDPTAVDATFFKKLQAKDRHYIETGMIKDLKLHPFCHIPGKEQVGSFCAWDNLVLAGLATAIVAHIIASQQPFRNLHDTESALIKAVRRINPFFEQWVRWDKDRFLNQLLDYYEKTQSREPDFLQLLFILGGHRHDIETQEKLISQLKKSPIKLEQLDSSGRNVLHYVSHPEQLHAIRLLGDPLTIDNTLRTLANQPDQTKWGTPLERAIQLNNVPIAHLLISLGAQAYLPNKNGCTPLWTAVAHNGSLEMMELLLRNGANPLFFSAAKGFTRTSPIFLAMLLNKPQALGLMLKFVHPKSVYSAGMLFQWAMFALQDPEASRSATLTLLRHYPEAMIKKVVMGSMLRFSIEEGMIPILYEAIVSSTDIAFDTVYAVLKAVQGLPVDLAMLLESRKNGMLPPPPSQEISVQERLGIISFETDLVVELCTRGKLDFLPFFLDVLSFARLHQINALFSKLSEILNAPGLKYNLQPYLQAVAIWEAIEQGDEQTAIQSVTDQTYFGPIGKWEITLLKRAQMRQKFLLEEKLLTAGAPAIDDVD